MTINDNSTKSINAAIIDLQNQIKQLQHKIGILSKNQLKEDDIEFPGKVEYADEAGKAKEADHAKTADTAKYTSETENAIHAGYADNATKATQDGSGNVITDTYATKTALSSGLAGKSDTGHTHTKSQITDFDHTHDNRYYTESEVDTKLSGKADKSHTHTKSEITDFPTSLPANGGTADNATKATQDGSGNVITDTYATKTELTSGLSGKANTSHNHSAADITSGTLAVERGGTGQTTQADINKAIVGELPEGDSVVTDGTMFVSSWASDNGFADTNATNVPYKRKFSRVWEYIKGKISSVLGITNNKHIIQGETVDTNTYEDANPKLVFINSDGSQNASLTFTDYDAVQAPASVTLNGNQGGEYFIAPNIKATGKFYGSLDGTADKATKATQDGSGNVITDTYATKTELTSGLSGKADKSHTHTKSEITDFPTSLPAKAYQIFGTQKVGWVKLGTLTSNPSESIVISVRSGTGFNGEAIQNSQFRIMIKNGNHAVESAERAFGVTVEKTEASYSVRVKVIAFSNNVCDVWVYMPWHYYAGNYSIDGLYLEWVHSGEYQSSEPSGEEQSLLYRTILNSEDTQTITGAKTFTNDITAPNITSLEQRVAALESLEQRVAALESKI